MFIVILAGFIPELMGQDTTSSLAFKKNRPEDRPFALYRPDLSYELWQHFNLLKEANAGNALAQHELGIRYILGEGFPADTVKAAYWLKRAAEQRLPGACYNYGIMLNNGWGVKWNPFEAYNYFLIAAENSMPQAEYLIGISYMDNLLVKRNWSEAFKWIKKSANDGFKPATETLAELRKNVSLSKEDTSFTDKDSNNKNLSSQNLNNISTNTLSSSSGLVFIDFNTVNDTVTQISDKILVEDILHEGNDRLAKALNLSLKNDSSITFDSTGFKTMVKFAENGSPEALTMLGKIYEIGVDVPRDILQAAVYYVRAIKLDSPRSPALLWKMMQKNNFYVDLKKLVDDNDPRAMFVWYGLFTIGFDNQIVEADAINLLKKAASAKYIPALNELGLDYYTGKFVKQNQSNALNIWHEAEQLGSNEAKLRIAIAGIYGVLDTTDYQASLAEIDTAMANGSVLAQATLAYCFESGIGVDKSAATAAKYYRFAAQRGSQFAFNQLKQMYNAIRPPDKEFMIN